MANKDCYTPNEFIGTSDSRVIQQAISEAIRTGCNTVTIPSYNARTDSYEWIINETILLPDNITVYLDNCRMTLAEGVFCNMFSNSLAYTDKIRRLENEQHDITLIGIGHPILDGGVYNGFSEHNRPTDGKTLHRNVTIFMQNVRDFKVENLCISNQRYWGMCFDYCRFGQIRDIDFRANLSMIDDNGVHHPDKRPWEYINVYIKNGDGIDLRSGCNNILIENISGFTQDDTVALTSLHGSDVSLLSVEGKDYHIHHVTIKNIRSSVWRWADNIRLLCQDGHKIHDILIDGVMDTSDPTMEYRNGAAVLISDRSTEYVRKQWMQMGDMYNISIQNIFSRAAAAIRFFGPLQFISMKNIHTLEGTNAAVACETSAELFGVEIDGIYCPAISAIDAVLDFNKVTGDLSVRNVYCEEADHVIRNTTDARIHAENIQVMKINKSYYDSTYVENHMVY